MTEAKIGVYVCHCGTNIAGTVDVKKVAEFASTLPNVAIARDYEFMCSDPGQDLIKKDIAELGLTRVVVASCSPLMHEPTFRKACAEGGINPYLYEMANIREHCSWVTEDKDKATEKAKALVAGAVYRVRLQEELFPQQVPVNPAVLVVGGGIAGIEAALKIADSGKKVYLVEKEASIGGHMAMLDKTFPTLDCSACILTPKMVNVSRHPNIELLTYSEVIKLEGYVGNFKATIRKKPRYVDLVKCTSCGECTNACWVTVPDEFEQGIGIRKAIHRLFPQAVPNKFVIEKHLAPCKATCPANTNVQGYVVLIAQGKFKEALDLVKETNPFPSICGRVCHRPCEKECSRHLIDTPVQICYLKRFAGDVELKLGRPEPEPCEVTKKEKVAIIGAGPCGLTAAHNLCKMGYKVTVFEALDVLGGMLSAGIPPFRLPREILNIETEDVRKMGVEIRTGIRVGKDITLKKIKEMGYSAVFIATGAWNTKKMGIPNDDAEGIIDCIKFLTAVNLGQGYKLGERIVVIGGGNAALDTSRTALRLGAKEVTIIYRRSRIEMPAEPEWEIDETEREGVKVQYLVAPVKVISENGRVKGLECIKMSLSKPDAGGRRSPEPIEGTNFVIPCDNVIPAIGQVPDFGFVENSDLELKKTRWGTLEVDPDTLQTEIPWIFGGGDLTLGPATLIEAIGQGKRAAIFIDRYLQKIEPLYITERVLELPRAVIDPVLYEKKPAQEMKLTPRETRKDNFEEIELGFSEEQAVAEANRCLNCGICSECMECLKACKVEAINHLEREEIVQVDVGSVIVATGYKIFDATRMSELGYRRYPNVLTSLEFERLCSASGPTNGEILTKDGRKPESIAILHCIGSRDHHYNNYCSHICCMYSLKFAHLVGEKTQALVHELFIDMRSSGKGYEEFYDRVMEEGAEVMRGRVAEITDVAELPSEEGKLIVCCESINIGAFRRIPVDMVVLSVAIEPTENASEIGRIFNISQTPDGFFKELHPKLGPVATTTSGVFIAGCCQGPKDIPDSVAQGAAAAAASISLADMGMVEIEPISTTIDGEKCAGCKICISLCPFTAITFDEEKKVSVVTEVLCQGCGTCAAACPSGVAKAKHFTTQQILAEIEGVLSL